MDKNKRLYYIDFLKFIGLTGIIIAHIGAPNWLMMLRSFDVPLMVILSSILAQKSYKKINDKNDLKLALKYYISRSKRLILPTWIFLIIYFTLRFIFIKEWLGIKYYLATFMLTRYGFGYVWIILIYLYSCMLVPIFNKMKFNHKNNLIILAIYIIYELCYFLKLGTANKIIDTTFYYIIPYGMLTYIGYNYNNLTNKERYIAIITNALLFVTFAIYYYFKTNTFQLVQISKYPPRIYYLSYGIMCSLALLIICQHHNFKIFKNKLITFISNHSMWIYLWHILAIDICQIFKFKNVWYLKLIFVYILSIIFVLTINKIINIIEKKHKWKIFKYLKG